MSFIDFIDELDRIKARAKLLEAVLVHGDGLDEEEYGEAIARQAYDVVTQLDALSEKMTKAARQKAKAESTIDALSRSLRPRPNHVEAA